MFCELVVGGFMFASSPILSRSPDIKLSDMSFDALTPLPDTTLPGTDTPEETIIDGLQNITEL